MSNESTAAAAADPLAGINIDPPVGGYPDHPFAAIFPMLPAGELAELADSIRVGGQRDDIVLFGGQVLDGRNRQAACFIAEVRPRYRNFDEATEGSPAQYVLDKNLRRRDLTQSQKAAAGAELMPILEREAAARQEASRFSGSTDTAPSGEAKPAGDGNHEYDAPREEDHGGGSSATTGGAPDAKGQQQGDEPAGAGDSTVDTSGEFSQVAPKKTAAASDKPAAGAKGTSRAKAAAAVGVSERLVQDATTLKKEDPAKFEEVKAGATTLGAALKSAPTAGTKAASEYEQAIKAIETVCGEKMAKAVKEGAILRTRKEVMDFADLPDAKMKEIMGLVGIGWSVKKALHHKTETLLSTHQIMDGISRAAQAGGEYKQVIEAPETGSDWEITIKRKTQAPAKNTAEAAPSTPAKPAATATPAKAAPAAPKKVTATVFKPKVRANAKKASKPAAAKKAPAAKKK